MRGGEALVIDGPFLESKEYLAGFWIIEAPDPGPPGVAGREM